jgi:hypothetical protein
LFAERLCNCLDAMFRSLSVVEPQRCQARQRFLAPRFAPSTRGWVMSGTVVNDFTPFGASAGEDSDDR